MRSALSLALLLAVPAAAQQVAPAPTSATPYARAIAAGYKAAMLCSGIFNAGRTERQVEADELAGIYPEYQAIVPTLAATIDREDRAVRVSWSPDLPPRWSVHRGDRGCVTYPIGSAPASKSSGSIRGPVLAPPDTRPWPLGDHAIMPLPSPALSTLVQGAFAGRYGAGAKTTGVLVSLDGKVIAERYAAGWGPFVSNRTWSVGKSIAGTLVGVAQASGGPRLDAPARIAAWANDPRAAITLDQLLRMGSGLHSDTAGNRTDAIYSGGASVQQDATHWPLEAKPGTRFRYANNDILLAVLSLRETLSAERYDRLPPDFFAALGMRHTVAERDWAGNYVLSSQVWSTARDLARLGQFWLQDGVWDGKRLLPEGWLRTMTTPSGPQPQSGPGYGATMWMFGPDQGLPAGSYAAQGNRGQYVMVIPSRRLVIVRRGEDPGSARFDIARFAADVAAAIP